MNFGYITPSTVTSLNTLVRRLDATDTTSLTRGSYILYFT